MNKEELKANVKKFGGIVAIIVGAIVAMIELLGNTPQ
jgi:hypothetical protein